MQYSQAVENMCPVAKGAYHGPAPRAEEGKWLRAQVGSMFCTKSKGAGYLELAQG